MADSISIKDLSIKEFFNSFSLLVVIGSISTSYFFARIFNAQPSYWFYHLLGTTVWAIYTTDHILDGVRNREAKLALRHLVHVRYRRELIFLVLIIAATNILLALRFLPVVVLNYGIGLAIFVLVYLLVVHILLSNKRILGKEIAISFGVTYGMALLPAVHGGIEWSVSNFLLLFSFTLMNLANLLIFSYFDRDHDQRSGFSSLVQTLGPRSVKQVINGLLSLIFVLTGVWAFTAEQDNKLYISIVFLFMLHVLAMIMLKEDTFREEERYRFWGDFIYLIPGLFWILIVEQVI